MGVGATGSMIIVRRVELEHCHGRSFGRSAVSFAFAGTNTTNDCFSLILETHAKPGFAIGHPETSSETPKNSPRHE